MPIEPNTTISHYKILSEIGRGGMGEVYLAQDLSLEREVAVKLLTHECCDDSEKLRRFAQEAKTASALNHPNIITIFEFGKLNEAHYMVSEYVDGPELKTILEKDNLSTPEALNIAVQIVSALKTAHEAGIVHRDIKPGNIMVRNDGLVKVLDFGLVKLTNKHRSAKNIDEDAVTIAKVNTNPGLIMGTPNYMSPEQARGQECDHQTDIFSFGILLYEMLTGVRPFTGETTSDIMASILKSEPASISETRAKTPAQLEAIVLRCLEKDKRNRYKTAAELHTDLTEIKYELELQDRLSRTDRLPNCLRRPKMAVPQKRIR